MRKQKQEDRIWRKRLVGCGWGQQKPSDLSLPSRGYGSTCLPAFTSGAQAKANANDQNKKSRKMQNFERGWVETWGKAETGKHLGHNWQSKHIIPLSKDEQTRSCCSFNILNYVAAIMFFLCGWKGTNRFRLKSFWVTHSAAHAAEVIQWKTRPSPFLTSFTPSAFHWQETRGDESCREAFQEEQRPSHGK